MLSKQLVIVIVIGTSIENSLVKISILDLAGEKFVIDWKPLLWTPVSHILLS